MIINAIPLAFPQETVQFVFMNLSSKIEGLYALCDNSFSPSHSHLELAQAFLRGGAKIIQLRMKEANLYQVKEVAQNILKEKEKYAFTFILNDYVELALELKVDGIHVGENDMPIREIRKIAQARRVSPLLGYSSHSIQEAKQAVIEGADYVAFGAIFPTKTKGPGHPVQGIEKLTQLVNEIPIPIVAIGGIKKDNLDSVLETGVDSIAMITALTQSTNVEEATRFFAEKCQKRTLKK